MNSNSMGLPVVLKQMPSLEELPPYGFTVWDPRVTKFKLDRWRLRLSICKLGFSLKIFNKKNLKKKSFIKHSKDL